MAKTTAPASRFLGFTSPNYTQVPDELFDTLMVELSGAELKVLLYIIRRTFGFKRDSDTISLSQMLGGLRASDGRQLDQGAGLTKKPLPAALRSLAERGVILIERRTSAERGNEPTDQLPAQHPHRHL
jgi:phage replication O-like protein O